MGGRFLCGGGGRAEGMWEISALSSELSQEPKVALKTKVLKKRARVTASSRPQCMN